MSTTIDSRVVEMRFDNRQFEANVATSMSTLDKLKQKLNFTGASKGLENISAAARDVDFSGMNTAIDTIKVKFGALEIAAVAVFTNIVNSAMNAGKRMAKALTVEPLISGLKEYELQLNSVQTILANTQHKGTNIDQVNAALDQLNTYADKTIYNFAEMTRNIGTFTAAGVGLNESVSAIKGIANLAAMSGSNAQQASTAMYQLSQALAAGRVSLMDWNSVVNAGMGGEVFQNALKRTARNMGIAVDEMITKYGSFRESLTQGQWLTAEVLTETLAQLSGAYDKEALMSQGFTEQQANEILQLAKTAEDAATKVKTFSQLVDTTKEAIQSGWAQSWRLILGDFEEARELFTSISKVLGDMISESSDYRNKILSEWHDLGGRDDLIEGLANAFKGLMSVVTPVKEAFRDIFPRLTTQNLLDFTSGLKELTSHMKLSEDSSEKLKTTFKGLFSILDIGKEAVLAVVKPLFNFATGGTMSSLGNAILTLTSNFGEFFISLRDGIKEGEAFSSVSNIISTAINGIGSAITIVTKLAAGMSEVFGTIGDIISNAFSGLVHGIGNILGSVAENITSEQIFSALAGFGVLKIANNVTGILNPIKEAVESLFDGSLKESAMGFRDILDSVHGSLIAFQQGIRVVTLLAISGAIALLASAIRTLSTVEPKMIIMSIAAIVASMAILNGGVKSLINIFDDFNAGGTIKASMAMIGMAAAVKILSSAIKDLSSLSFGQITQGLIAVATSIIFLTKGINAISKTDISLKTSVSIIALASACKILADALTQFGSLDIFDTAQGLIAMGLALGEVVLVMKAFDQFGKSGLKGAASLLIAVHSLNEIADALTDISKLDWGGIGRGLVGMGLALTEVAVVSALMGKLSGSAGLIGAATLVIGVQSLNGIANALSKLAELSWENVFVGLTAMGGALTELAVVSGILGTVAGLPAMLGGGALIIAVQSLGELADAMLKFGSLSLGQTVTALIGLGGALVELGVVTSLLGGVAALPAMLGGGAILIAVQGLGELADALKKFGSMPWGDIIKGLVSMGVAMGATALGAVLNSLSGVGASAIADIAAPLGTLADSIKKWAGVVVPESIGTQLASLAKGVRAFTFGEWGAENLALAVEPLGQLAGAISKWSGVTIPDELGTKLTSLASGIKAFTFAFIGAQSLALTATGLSLLADAIKKFQGMDLSFASFNISQLSAGLKNLGTVGISELITGFQNAASSIATKAGEIVTNVQNMMTNFASAISSRVGEITTNAQNIMNSIYTAVTTKATSIINSIRDTMNKFVSSISEKVSSASSAMYNVMSGIVNSIMSKATEIVNSIREAMRQFVQAIQDKTGAAGNAMSSVIKAVKSAANVASSMYNIGVNIAQGLINGLKSMLSKVQQAASELANAASGAARSSLDVKSPSRVFIAIGEYVGEGMTIGLRNSLSDISNTGTEMADTLVESISSLSGDVEQISKEQIQNGGLAVTSFLHGVNNQMSTVSGYGTSVGDTMITALKSSINRFNLGNQFVEDISVKENFRAGLLSTIDKIMMALNSDMNLQPTIRPIVDLSDVKGKSRVINSMFSRDLAMSVAGQSSVSRASDTGINASTNQNGASFQFIQNNYSPKALSRVDIYRQTKNQFAELKGVFES